ncbi:hypothetical protein [Aquisalinus flavus]|uniref:Lipoprotein n=1 Tax=Aquisalinus flavus TaxID=1526572 RepID=A0A8J2Y595_9PROT|nr:hypothetical protein [Aquisalinus flavus]MBD0426692.1 hypothetical protein [Aquisalinus flavus]UNE46562.1 hypothetical protein FF099_00015 [Aquisalinus flavus]GGC95201.1 hypothetical protein GCM10011342_00030 [Aquisalinus flavus]
MRRIAVMLLSLSVAIAACGPERSDAAQTAGQSSALAAGSGSQLRLQPAKIMDPSGFEQPMLAASSVIPAGWTPQGGVIWRQGDCTMGATSNWQATAPGEAAGIFLMPGFGWRANTMGMPVPQDCVAAAYQSADEAAAHLARQMPGGRVVAIQAAPEMKQAAQMMSSQIYNGDPNSRTWFDATSARIEYTYQGAPYEAIVSLMTFHMLMTMPGYGFGPDSQAAAGGTMLVTAFAARKGTLEQHMPVFDAFVANYREDPAYARRMAQHQAKMSGIMMEGSRKRHEAIMEGYRATSSSSIDIWRGSNDDAIRRKEIDAIRGEDTFSADTPSGEISLPSGYSSAWQMNDGSFVVTDDQFFDPMDGKRLSPAY